MSKPLMPSRNGVGSAFLRPGFPPRDDDPLRVSRKALACANASLERVVAERTAELRGLILELEEVSHAIVHNMRAPLRAMQGFARMLEQPEVSIDDRHEYVRRIIIGAGRLDKLILDVLAYNNAVLRILPLEAVSLFQLVRGLIDTGPQFQPENAEIRVADNLPVVFGNEGLLTQCFSNLLENAVRFVAPGVRPRIQIRAENAGTMARIWVEDNGVGIPGQVQPRLFGLFEKQNHESGGTGLGLAIVRKTVERMDGRAGVESEPGKGSRFWVELKRANRV